MKCGALEVSRKGTSGPSDSSGVRGYLSEDSHLAVSELGKAAIKGIHNCFYETLLSIIYVPNSTFEFDQYAVIFK